jgi:cation diffusion facilitator CzcD-associated flavoprotein CzcO
LDDRTDKLAVIGAGPVGLAIAKGLKAHQIAYEHLEADDEVGGNWYHGVYRTAHIISSKHTTEYTDFPMPDHYPDFPSRVQMYEYLCAYADHFDLRSEIQFRTKVVRAIPRPNDSWEVELADGARRLYKGLVICNGHHWSRRWPNYPGEFAGEYIHSKDYQSPSQLEGRRVLVIGGGNSACDFAAEAARVAASCQISLRRGYWFLPKTIFGRPLVDLIKWWVPVGLQRMALKVVLRVMVGRYEQYGLPRPSHRIFEAHPTINSELLHYMKHGKIKPRPDIERFDGRRVYFVDGQIDEFDLIVCATGFNLDFPFLPPGMVPVKGSMAQLYGGAMLPDYKNLYIVGTTQPRYGFGPLATIGTDLLARVIKMQDELKLPIGLVLKESGKKIPRSHLVNPHQAMRQMKIDKLMLPLLRFRERRLRRRFEGQPAMNPEIQPSPPPAPANPHLQVY